ncbi:MAG: hypothetical protein MZV64_09485 [Ignavibacteriales bacterium]|nr:hypothetical protein [Ignavibacteriales bacterium]
MATDTNLNIQFMNTVAEDITGYKEAAVKGASLTRDPDPLRPPHAEGPPGKRGPPGGRTPLFLPRGVHQEHLQPDDPGGRVHHPDPREGKLDGRLPAGPAGHHRDEEDVRDHQLPGQPRHPDRPFQPGGALLQAGGGPQEHRTDRGQPRPFDPGRGPVQGRQRHLRSLGGGRTAAPGGVPHPRPTSSATISPPASAGTSSPASCMNCAVQDASNVAKRLQEAAANRKFIWQSTVFPVTMSIGIVPLDPRVRGHPCRPGRGGRRLPYRRRKPGGNKISVFQVEDSAFQRRRGRDGVDRQDQPGDRREPLPALLPAHRAPGPP